MPELKEVFEMVTKQTEPKLDSWQKQEQRQRQVARNRRVGAVALVAAIIATLVVAALTLPGENRTNNTGIRPPSDERQGFLVIDVATGSHGTIGHPDGQTPDVSPDGTLIAFTREVDGHDQIFVMNVDGSNVTRVTDTRFGAEDPDWSPDGRAIAYQALYEGDEQTDWDIWVVDVDTGATQQLTHEQGEAFSPSWSPGGEQVLYTVERPSAKSVLRVLDVRTGQVTQLTRRGEAAAEGSWSPDGTRIVYSLDAVGGGPDPTDKESHGIWVMDTDGIHRLELVPGPSASFGPQFSPDGGGIVYFVEDEDGCCDTYVVDVDSGGTRKLAEATLFPTWFDDGSVIAVDFR